MLPNLELSARFRTQQSVLNLGVFCLWNATVRLTFVGRRRPVRARLPGPRYSRILRRKFGQDFGFAQRIKVFL